PGSNGGAVTIIAGGTALPTNLSVGNINTAVIGGGGTGGAVTLLTQVPTATGGTAVTYDQSGNLTAGGPIVGNGTTITTSGLSVGNIVTAGGNVNINGGQLTLGNITAGTGNVTAANA